jgi:putative Mg2+ transporter-C (MgtC) family protein
MDDWWRPVLEDFGDVPDLGQLIRLVVRLLLAALLGGVVGYDRQRSGKAAGLRTHMLVALGSAMFVLVPERAGMTASDLSRVIQGLVAGVGFLGAGAILKRGDEGVITGLTTAAGLWLTAAVGIAAGLGREITAIVGTCLALFVLAALTRVDLPIARDNERVPSTENPLPGENPVPVGQSSQSGDGQSRN